MQDDRVTEADQLRDIQMVLLPDSRCRDMGYMRADGTISAATIEDRHQMIAEYVLSDAVPMDIRVHFETARNLYLYAWFVYRFFPVAEKQALATLEFALRERLQSWKKEDPKSRRKRKVPRGLRNLFEMAMTEGLISNDGLRKNQRWAEGQARQRVMTEKIRELTESNLDQIEYDLSAVVPIQDDYSRDWMKILSESLPSIRNTYAHGSSMLHSNVLPTFETVVDLVNQLYKVQKY